MTLTDFQRQFYGRHMTIKLGVFTDRNERQRIDERSCTSATLNEMHTYEVSNLIIGKIKGKLSSNKRLHLLQ